MSNCTNTFFEENEEIIQLPCSHIFNKEGILQWLKEEQSKCPVCRYELPYDEIEIKSKNINDISSMIFLLMIFLLMIFLLMNFM